MTRLLASALFLSACGTSVPTGSAQQKTATPTTTPVAGAACTQSTDCITGEACNTDAGKCQPNCTQNQDCSKGQVCGTNSFCQAPPSGGSTHCTTKNDCQPGQVCLQNACLNSGAGGACTQDSDCSSSASCANNGCTCTGGKCTVKSGAACTPQTAYNVCQTSEFCDGTTDKCSPARTCTQQSDCQASGLVCNAGYCKTPQPCSNGTCPTGFACTSSYCLPDDTGKTCASDNDCGSGYYCNLTGGGLTGGLSGGSIGGLIGGSSAGGGSGGTCAAGCKSNADCPVAGDICDTSNSHQCISGSTGGSSSGSTAGGVGQPCHTDDDCEPGCTSPSTLVCDIDGLTSLVGGNGYCRVRCIEAVLGCPSPTQSCNSVSNPTQALYPAGYCGLSPAGGFSYCE